MQSCITVSRFNMKGCVLMARKSGISFKVSGKMKIRQQTKYEMAKNVANMTRKEIAKECRRYFDMANKRIKRLETSGLLSPALHAVLKEGPFHAKGKDLNQLRHEYSRVMAFLNMTTSTVAGARQYESHISNIMGGKLSDKQKSTLFDAFRRIKEVSPAGLMSYGSDRLISYLADEIRSEDDNIEHGPDVDFEAMVKKAMDEVMGFYDKIEEEFNNAFKNAFTI